MATPAHSDRSAATGAEVEPEGVHRQAEASEERRLAGALVSHDRGDQRRQQRAERVGRREGVDHQLLVLRALSGHDGHLELGVVDVEAGRRDVALLARDLDDVVLVDPTQLADAAHETDLVAVELDLELLPLDVELEALQQESAELLGARPLTERRSRHRGGGQAASPDGRLRELVLPDGESVALDVDLDCLDGELIGHVERVELHLAVELAGLGEGVLIEEVEAVAELSVTEHCGFPSGFLRG